MKTKEQVKKWLETKYVESESAASLLNGWLKCRYGDNTNWPMFVFTKDMPIVPGRSFIMYKHGLSTTCSYVTLQDLIDYVNAKEFKVTQQDLIDMHNAISFHQLADAINYLNKELIKLKK